MSGRHTGADAALITALLAAIALAGCVSTSAGESARVIDDVDSAFKVPVLAPGAAATFEIHGSPITPAQPFGYWVDENWERVFEKDEPATVHAWVDPWAMAYSPSGAPEAFLMPVYFGLARTEALDAYYLSPTGGSVWMSHAVMQERNGERSMIMNAIPQVGGPDALLAALFSGKVVTGPTLATPTAFPPASLPAGAAEDSTWVWQASMHNRLVTFDLVIDSYDDGYPIARARWTFDSECPFPVSAEVDFEVDVLQPLRLHRIDCAAGTGFGAVIQEVDKQNVHPNNHSIRLGRGDLPIGWAGYEQHGLDLQVAVDALGMADVFTSTCVSCLLVGLKPGSITVSSGIFGEERALAAWMFEFEHGGRFAFAVAEGEDGSHIVEETRPWLDHSTSFGDFSLGVDLAATHRFIESTLGDERYALEWQASAEGWGSHGVPPMTLLALRQIHEGGISGGAPLVEWRAEAGGNIWLYSGPPRELVQE